MLFIHPMWWSEVQRVGKLRCTPVGYKLHVTGDLLGILGLLILLMTPLVLLIAWFRGSYSPSQHWLWAVAFGVGVLSEIVYQYSWHLAAKKGFHYDYTGEIATWVEGGQRQTLRAEDLDPRWRRS